MSGLRSVKPVNLDNRREYFPTIANNSTDSEHDLDIGAARIWVSDGTTEKLVDFDAATIAIDGDGLDTGTVANSTWYYIWGLYNPTTDAADYLISASATSPTLPSGYTYKRFLCDSIAAAVLTDGSANVLSGDFIGSRFHFSEELTDYSDITWASFTELSSTVSVPPLPRIILHTNLLAIQTNASSSDVRVMSREGGVKMVAGGSSSAGRIYQLLSIPVESSTLWFHSTMPGSGFSLFLFRTIGWGVL